MWAFWLDSNGSCEYSNEPLSSIKYEEFIHLLNDYDILKKASAVEIYNMYLKTHYTLALNTFN